MYTYYLHYIECRMATYKERLFGVPTNTSRPRIAKTLKPNERTYKAPFLRRGK